MVKRGGVHDWALWDDKSLLELRLCDLDLRIEDTPLQKRVERLYRELEARGIRFRPHVWLSTEWFSPDGVPGFAVPFYLAHPRLMRLEYAHMHSMEGATEEEFMKLLRHEAGHAFSTAYRLHRRQEWRGLFGRYSEPYRATYSPNPRSRDYVRNLDAWYAQSHPAEDFCETFAQWLRPRSNWRHRYAGWRAIRKLQYVDREMKRIAALAPVVRSRERTESLASLRVRLDDYYRRKTVRYSAEGSSPEDANLRLFFTVDEKGIPPAGPFLRAQRRHLLKRVARLTEQDLYTIDQALKRLIERAFQLDLRVQRNAGSRRAATALLTMETLETLRGRRLEYSR